MKFNIETNDRPYDVAFIGSKNERRERLPKLNTKNNIPTWKVYVGFLKWET